MYRIWRQVGGARERVRETLKRHQELWLEYLFEWGCQSLKLRALDQLVWAEDEMFGFELSTFDESGEHQGGSSGLETQLG